MEINSGYGGYFRRPGTRMTNWTEWQHVHFNNNNYYSQTRSGVKVMTDKGLPIHRGFDFNQSTVLVEVIRIEGQTLVIPKSLWGYTSGNNDVEFF